MAEVIGAISGVIALIETSIKVYESARKDIKLPETFEVVQRRLPVILNTLTTCKSNLTFLEDKISKDVSKALEKTLEACAVKAVKLRGIFEKIISNDGNDTWKKRYSKVLHRFGKGSKVEELMIGLAEDVQVVVNHHAVLFANQQQKDDFGFCGPVGLCLGQAPYIASEFFIGRAAELDEIENSLNPSNATQKEQRIVLGGMGGIGKTRLAIAYAESRSGSYSSVIWLNAASKAALKDTFRSIASRIFQDTRVLESEDIIGHVHRWLSNSENTQWLLIFDNYDDPDQFDINDYYPQNTCHGDVIITTRWPDRVGGKILHVKPLQDIDDSLAVLQTRSKRENVHSDPYARRLAERLGGLPLALATAGLYLQRSTLTFERYLQEYDRRWNIDPHRPTQLQEYRERTLYTTWDLSYARLKADHLHAANFLKLLAYFGNETIWYEIFWDGLSGKSPKWLNEVVVDEMSFQGVMGILVEYYFLEVHLESASWSIHNCVHDWMLAALNTDIDMDCYWYALDCVDTTISDISWDSFGHIKLSRLAGHAARLVHYRFLETDITIHPTAGQLDKLLRASKLLQEQVQFTAAEKMYTWTLAGYETVLGPDHSSTLRTVLNLGNLHREQGNLNEAEQLFTQALARKEESLGPDDISILEVVNNLGALYHDQGRLDKAKQMYMRALASYETAKALGPDHTLTLICVHNIGNLYHDQGKLDEAEQMYTRALAGCEKSLGTHHPSTLETVLNIGNVYRDQEKPEEAEKMYTWALDGREKALGPSHTSTLNAVNNLGVLYHDQGRLDEALKMSMRVLTGREKALGPDHISTIQAVYNLGTIYRDQDDPQGAEMMFLRALKGYDKVWGPKHSATLNAVHRLGVLYRDQGEIDEAEHMLSLALKGYEEVCGPDHITTLDAVQNRGLVYWDQGKLDEAEVMILRALKGYEKVWGPDHSATLDAVHNLGLLYHDQGRLDESEKMFLRGGLP